jgi:short-subunit dehydrogenase
MEILQGKNIVIAGATGGIGKETARLLRQSGGNVFLMARDQAKLQSIASELGIAPAQCFVADATKSEDIRRAGESIHAQCGTVDILINAVGIGIIKPLESLTEHDMMHSLQVNLMSAFHLVQTFVPAMKVAKKGLIINMPGVLGKTPMAGAMAYSAAKYGLNGMMKSLREELKRTDIRITNIFLGGTDTAFWDTIDMRVQRDKFITAKEAARSIWFLCQQPTSGVVSELVLQPFNHQAI